MSYCFPSWNLFFHFYIFSSEKKKKSFQDSFKGIKLLVSIDPYLLRCKFPYRPPEFNGKLIQGLYVLRSLRISLLDLSLPLGKPSFTKLQRGEMAPPCGWFCQDAFCCCSCLVHGKTICSLPNFTADPQEQLDRKMITSALFFLERVSSFTITYLHT